MIRRDWCTLAALLGSLTLLPAAPAAAQGTFNSGSTGADGALSPGGNVTIPLPPSGVFNYTTISIPPGVTVTFTRNAANTPVTLLASGDVSIGGTITLDGQVGGDGSLSIQLQPNGGRGGPGGSDGGTGANGLLTLTSASGLGPGGGPGGPPGGPRAAGHLVPGNSHAGTGDGTGGLAYGTTTLLPLLGGSGGAGGGLNLTGHTGGGGGGGGGAILIASSGTLTLTGTISARGGNGGASPYDGGQGSGGSGGSGGAVRLIATTLTGPGTLAVDADGGGSVGRVRAEAFIDTAAFTLTGTYTPRELTVATPTSVTLPSAPTLTITAIAGVAPPSAPTGAFAAPDVVLPTTTTNPVTVAVAGANIPPGTPVALTVTGQFSGASTTTATLAGTLSATTASAALTLPTDQPSVIAVTVSYTVAALGRPGPVFVEGQEIERVRVVAMPGGATRTAFITRTGRELVPAGR